MHICNHLTKVEKISNSEPLCGIVQYSAVKGIKQIFSIFFTLGIILPSTIINMAHGYYKSTLINHIEINNEVLLEISRHSQSKWEENNNINKTETL